MSRADVDRIARLLEGDRAAAAEAAEEERDLAALATLLRDAQPEVPPMRAEFRASLRGELIEAARTQQAEAPLLTRMRAAMQRFKYSTGLAGATGVASMALAGGGVAGAAEFAQPGDLLYGTKLAIEDVRLATTFDDTARGRRALLYAADRVEEAETAVAEGDQPGAAVALEGAAERTDEGSRLLLASEDDGALLDLLDAIEDQRVRVERLLPRLGPEAARAAEVLLVELATTREAIAEQLPAAPGTTAPGAGDLDGPTTTPDPTQGTAPPAATAPPAQGGTDDTEVLPEPGEVLPEPGEVLPEPGEVLPEPGEVLPEPGEVLPEPEEVLPEPEEVLPEPEEVLPDEVEDAVAPITPDDPAGLATGLDELE